MLGGQIGRVGNGAALILVELGERGCDSFVTVSGATMPDLDGLWSQVLTELGSRLPKGTLEHFKRSKPVSFDGGVLTLSTRNKAAQEWISARLRPMAEDAATRVLGERVTIAVELASKNEHGGEMLHVAGSYEDARNAIVKPDRMSIVTEYYRLNWVPRLGTVLSWVIIALRRRAYYNRRSRERREGFRFRWSDLAKEIGVSEDTITRALQRECHECVKPHPVAEHFILERTFVYRENPRRGRRERIGTFVRIRLDDPLTPTDREKLEMVRRSSTPQNAD